MNNIFLYPAHNKIVAEALALEGLIHYNILGGIRKADGEYELLERGNNKDTLSYKTLESKMIEYSDALFIVEDDKDYIELGQKFLSMNKSIIRLMDKSDSYKYVAGIFKVYINNTRVAFEIVNSLRKLGYKTNIVSDSMLANLVSIQQNPQLIVVDGEANTSNDSLGFPYMEIALDDNSLHSIKISHYNKTDELLSQPINLNNYIPKLIDIIKKQLLKHINILEIISTDIGHFKENERRQFHRFRILDSYFLFEANSRICYSLDEKIYKFLGLYFENEKEIISDYFDTEEKDFILQSYENFSRLRYHSALYCKKLEHKILDEQEWHSGESIISFLGKRNCNLRCKYCFMEDDKQKVQEEELSEELIRDGLDFILQRKKNTQRVRADYSLGGEPLLTFDTYKKLWSIVKEYDEKEETEVALGFITNATLLNDKVIDWFNKNHHWIGFSLDGGKEVHDSMRVFANGKGSFEVAYSNISKVLNLNWEHTPGVNVVLTAANPDILHIFQELWELGFRIITIKPVRANSKEPFAITLDNIAIIKENYLKFAKFLVNSAKEGNFEFLKAILVPFDFFGRFLMRVFMRDRVIVKRCPGGSRIFSVRNNGDMYPCDSFNGMDAFKIGNLKDKTFDETLFVPPKVTEVEGCMDCWARYLCGGVCSYTAHINRCSGETASDAECELEKYLIMLSCYVWNEIKGNVEREYIQDIEEYIKLMTGGSTW